MRRLICITAFALSLAVPVWAQHGGGHGGGGHAGFGGGHGGGFAGHTGIGGGGHISGGMHAGPGRGFSHTARAGFSRGPFLHDGFRGRIRSYGFRNNCYGYGCRWGYGYPWGWGYWDPWWWDNSSSYDDSYNQNLAIAAEMNRENLEEQQMLRQEQADGDQDLYARREAPQPAVEQKAGTPLMPGTVLVFRDQHREEIQNYAIVGQTLWNFAAQHTEKISLAQLDLAATAQANDNRGVTFRIPAPNQAQ